MIVAGGRRALRERSARVRCLDCDPHPEPLDPVVLVRLSCLAASPSTPCRVVFLNPSILQGGVLKSTKGRRL